MLTDEIVNTRAYLRETTREAHDALDRIMSEADLCDPRAYARFLQVQHAARAPIESWCERHAPIDLRPPLQTPLIAADLEALGHVPEPPRPSPVAIPADAESLAVAWVLAGSALGNRSMLAELRKRDAALPTRFLGDDAMFQFWRDLKPLLERPVEPGRATRLGTSASQVFDLFLEEARAARADRKGLAA